MQGSPGRDFQVELSAQIIAAELRAMEMNQTATAASHEEMRQPEFQSRCGSGLGLRRRRGLLLGSSLGLFDWLRFRSFLRGFLWLLLGGCLRLDRDQLDFENEREVGADRRAGRAPLEVSEIRGNKELPLGADGHELNRFGPALDD